MKVLQIIHNLELAGAEIVVRDLALGLNRRGEECDIYLMKRTDSELQRSLQRQGVAIYGESAASLYSPLQLWRLAAHLRAHRYDILQVHLFPAQLWAALALKRAHTFTSLVITEHSAYNYRRQRIYRPIDKWVYAQSRAIACVSDAARDALVQWIPGVAAKAHTCFNGIDVEAFASATRRTPCDLPVCDNNPIILSVGRLMYQKDHSTVIRALRNIPGAHFWVVGVGPDRESHERLARELGVADRIHFLGQRTDIAQLMKAADVFVQSSRFEGFGIAALEAMACGVPVLASRVPGLAQLIDGAGILFEPGNDRELAVFLNEILANPEWRQRLRETGRKRAAAFSLEKMLDRYQDLYRELILETEVAANKMDAVLSHRIVVR